MNIRLLIKIVGALITFVGLILLIPTLFSLYDNTHYTQPFSLSSALAILLGLLLFLSQRKYQVELNHRTALAVVSVSWIGACLMGALPYYLTGHLNLIDAIFESTSGFTGTGASVIANVEIIGRPLLLWRSMTQWLAGLGIIVFFIAILPALGFGGVQLFRAEITGPNKDRITPRVAETARKLWLIYLAFTLLLVLLLKELGGMSYFDAINHSLTTLSTGGFSTKNAGISHFNNPIIDYILVVFMLIGAVNFNLHFRLIRFRDWRITFDTEFKWYLGMLLGATVAICICNYRTSYETLSDSFRHSLFSLVAAATSTGFSNANYIQWPLLTHFLILLTMIMGGMSGSTAGGIKCIRIVAALKQLWKEFKQIVHPNAVITIKANHKTIPELIVSAIWSFIFLYFFILLIACAIIVAHGTDLISAVSAVISALSGVGPALGQLGPADNYANLPNGVKATLSFCMLLGRLELFAVLVILTPTYWKR